MIISDIDSNILKNFYREYKIESNVSLDIDNEKATNPYIKYYFYVDGNKVLGYIAYFDIYDRFEIVNIYVLKSYRKRKIGSDMIQLLIHEGENKNIRNITLEVNKENIPAIALYQKYGFKNVAIRKGYYSGVDGILMEKEMM